MEELKLTGETIQYIVIRLGQEQYGIDIKYIDNIVRMQHMTRVPKMPAYLKGVINLRGEVVPVMSIRTKMGLESDVYTNATRIIILKIEDRGMLGVIVDAVCEVVTLATDEVEPNNVHSNHTKDNFINGIGKNGDQLISLLEINAIIEEKDNA